MNAAPDHRRTDAARLAAIRAQVEALGAAEWQLGADGDGMLVETSMKVAGGVDRVLLCRFGPHATSDEMQFVAEAKRHVGFLLGLVDRAVAAMKANPSLRCRASLPQGARKGGTADDGVSSTPSGGRGGAGEARDGVGGSPPNYAAEAAIKCGEPAFRVFLEERHGMERPLTDDKVAARLRSLLGVTSRRDLNSDERAAARWKDIRREFDAWRTGR